jgi:hypothetical protein
MNTVTFFITTARSGTQWVARTLRETYPDLLSVQHEPIRYDYAPKRCLRNPSELASLRMVPTVQQHFGNIHETLKTRSYVETGFPAFAAAPLLVEEFGERLRLVQLIRHPARVAASIMTHRWYQDGARPDIEADVALSPTDAGVRLCGYQLRWNRMSEYEKALFFWAQVHLYGLEVETTYSAVPFTRVTFEDLLTRRDARVAFARFLNVPYRPEFDLAPLNREDSFRQQTVMRIDFGKVHDHPAVAALAQQFGYDTSVAEMQKIGTRYKAPPFAAARRRLNTVLRKFTVSMGLVGAWDVMQGFNNILAI